MLMQTAGLEAGNGLTVLTIDSWEGFAALRHDWDALHRRDMQASFFLSWEWLAQGFRANPYRWTVLAVRALDGALVCVVPLKYRVHWSTTREEIQTELEAGGRLIWSEYTGFLCEPALEGPALAAAARALSEMPWARLSMRYVAQKRRAEIFTEELAALGMEVRFRSYLINKGETNNLLCPQVDLPEDFDTYLARQVSANTRQRYNKMRRRHFDTGAYRIEVADATSFETELDGLLENWLTRWQTVKGESTARRVGGNFRDMMMAAQACDAAFLPVLCQGERRLGALGHILDRHNGVMHYIIAGRDTSAEEPFIGDALHFHSIEAAIDKGYVCYDFGHGNESFKYSYGAEDHETVYFDVRRPEPGASGYFDLLCLGEAMRRMEGYLKDGKAERAQKICRQVAELFEV